MSRKAYSVFIISFLAILLATGSVYWQGLDGPFLLDDYQNISNAYVENFSPDEIFYAVTHNESGTFGRPVSVLSFVITGLLHGQEAWGYKFHNLIIHIINGLLILLLVQKLLLRISVNQDKENAFFISAMVAGIWLLHPLMVSTVLYAVQRMAQLATLFTLSSLLIYAVIRENVDRSPLKYYALAYLLFPISMALAVLSKENGALIPLYILVLEFIVYQFKFSNSGERNRMLVFLGIFVALPVIAGSVYTLTHLDQLTDYSARNFDMGERLLTQLHVVGLYLKMILLPRLSDMTLYHDYIAVTSSFDFVTIMLLLLLLLAIFLMFYLRKKAPVAALAIAWFLVGHLMESTIFSLELMFEHRNYLAAIGPLLAMVYYLCRVPDFPQLKYVSSIFLLLMVFMTVNRVHEWSSRDMLYRVAIAEHPDSPRAQTEMAIYKYTLGDIGGALEHLSETQKLNEKEFGSIIHEIVYRCGSGWDMSALFEEARQRGVNYPASAYSLGALENLLAALSEDKCPEVSSQNLVDFIGSIKTQKNNQINEQYLGYLENLEGKVYLMMGKYQESINLILSAYDKTGTVTILSNLAENLIQLNFIGDAEVLVNEIALINAGSFGSEAFLLASLHEKLAAAKERVASKSTEELPENGEQ